MRLFVAIPLPLTAQALVRGFAQTAADAFPAFRWTNPAKLHITLKFLGDADEPTLLAAKKAVGSVTPGSTFALRFGKALRLGPDGGALALELDGETDRLASLQSRIEAAFGRLGFATEGRPFLPHVTVARLPRNASTAVISGVGVRPPVAPKKWFTVTSVQLLHSTPGGGGSVYQTLLNVPMIDNNTFAS